MIIIFFMIIFFMIIKNMIKQNYDILGIGNAVTDILVEVDYSFLKKNELLGYQLQGQEI